VHGPTPLGWRPPGRTPSTKPRPRLPATSPCGIRGGRVVGVVAERKPQVRRGCSGAQVWTRSPHFRPYFRPPLRPRIERSAAADSASTGTGPTPTANWPPRWTRRTRKGGVRRKPASLRPEVRRWRDARRTSSTGSDLHSCLGVYGSQRGRRDSLCPSGVADGAVAGLEIVAPSVTERTSASPDVVLPLLPRSASGRLDCRFAAGKEPSCRDGTGQSVLVHSASAARRGSGVRNAHAGP
jgi:hypothetical protein